MSKKAFQDYYPDKISHCYGCGRLNAAGLKIKSYWDGEETVCIHEPGPEHIANPGIVYEGLIASLISCHSSGTAVATKYRAENREMDSLPTLRFITSSLRVDFLLPTPMGVPLEIRGRVKEIKGKKVIVESSLFANGQICARGEVVAVQIPECMMVEKM